MLYGSKHLAGLAAMLALAASFFLLTHLFVNKKGVTAMRKALKGFAISLLVLEFIKYMVILHGDGTNAGAIDPGAFPLHLCSMALWLFPVAAFGEGRLARYLRCGAYCVGFFGALVLFYPVTVMGGDTPWLADYGFNMHLISFLYHTIMVTFSIYMLISKTYSPQVRDILRAYSVFVACAALAYFANLIIPGANYMFFKPTDDNYLFTLIKSFGAYIYKPLVFLVGFLLVCSVYTPQLWISRKRHDLSSGNETA